MAGQRDDVNDDLASFDPHEAGDSENDGGFDDPGDSPSDDEVDGA